MEICQLAEELLDLAPEELMMVAARGRDLDGARAAGFRTAYIERPQ
jgi:2-haloacid dehalogenase